VVVWADFKHDPSVLQLEDIGVPIQFVKTRKDSLNERFAPYNIIQTEAVASIDDDTRSLNENLITGAFR